MRKPKPTCEELREVISQMTRMDAACEYGVSFKTIQEWTRKCRIPLRNQGSKHHAAKLTEDDVRLIRALREDGMPYEDLMEKFEISKTSVHNICTYASWRHVL